jgi:ParB family chromosome partitioning protein
MADTTTTVEHLDPRTLLVDHNIRDDARLTKDFINSVKTHGVLQPIIAVTTHDGAHRVRHGHRRTLAAIEAGRDTVPVIITGTDHGDDTSQIDRILQQHAENEHRAGLTNTERVHVAEQLAAFGLTPTQISRRTHQARAHVDAALTVAGSDLAKAAASRYQWLTIDQAAVVADFDHDPDAVKALVAAAQTGRFEHTAQRLRDQQAEQTARQQQLQRWEADGLTVTDPPGRHSPTRPLDHLTDPDGQQLDPSRHRETCPGHVVWPEQEWRLVDGDGNPVDEDDPDLTEDTWRTARQVPTWVPVPGCADPTAHQHQGRYTATSPGSSGPQDGEPSEEEREAAREHRRLVIANNKAWDSAQTVRRAWVKQLLTRKTPPKGTGPFLAAILTRHPTQLASIAGNQLAADWFGIDHQGYGYSDGLAQAAANATDKRAEVIALGLVLAAIEADTSRDTWRHDNTENADHHGHGRYLRFLACCGYQLSEVEEYALTEHTA